MTYKARCIKHRIYSINFHKGHRPSIFRILKWALTLLALRMIYLTFWA